MDKARAGWERDWFTGDAHMNITDWRELKLGDVVEIVGCYISHEWKEFRGSEMEVSHIDSDYFSAKRKSDGRTWCVGCNTQWRFIRRP